LTPDVVELFGVVDGVALLPLQRIRRLLGNQDVWRTHRLYSLTV